MRRIWTLHPCPPEQVGVVRTGVRIAGAMEDLADLNTATEQILAGSLDVGDDQIKPSNGAGRHCGDVSAEDDRAPGARRRELDHAKIGAVVVVGVEPPPE